jgi:hypothetical protein
MKVAVLTSFLPDYNVIKSGVYLMTLNPLYTLYNAYEYALMYYVQNRICISVLEI